MAQHGAVRTPASVIIANIASQLLLLLLLLLLLCYSPSTVAMLDRSPAEASTDRCVCDLSLFSSAWTNQRRY